MVRLEVIKVASILALAAGLTLSGCALSRGRREHQPEAHTREQHPASIPIAAPHKPEAPAQDSDAARVHPASFTAGLYQAQPEPVPPPPPSSTLPLAFAGGTTLEELERLAEERHPKLLAAMQEIEAAHGRTWQAGRMPNPSVGASSPQLAGSESQYNVFVSQDIPTGGKLRLNEAAAAEEIDQAELALSRTRQDVL